ncbi:OsmC family protein [Egibacter rhizosphaerae]|uniref:OsmC family protein n=1 Tax=Egibacter rhizosphaerae TaxID=1670831 RepID=UPI003B834328
MPADDGRLVGLAEGEVGLDGKTLVLQRIHVRFELQVDPDADRATIDRVHGFFADRCPVYRSIHPQIHCSTEVTLVEA